MPQHRERRVTKTDAAICRDLNLRYAGSVDRWDCGKSQLLRLGLDFRLLPQC
jgi:hypothetical protein